MLKSLTVPLNILYREVEAQLSQNSLQYPLTLRHTMGEGGGWMPGLDAIPLSFFQF